MQLNKLYINGFKTFAGKFEFDFKEGITAIVGPNGSGKSNLSDAIRWALGEQSIRLLRGSTLADVIFAGTSSRKQSGMAEVTVVIDNGDRAIPLEYDEVSVTRRVFRNGESQFLINGIECRLRDINDMFAGTGLGKETYAVIEQGKVDAIISSQPNDRRGIFDEASGIMRYKNRKKDAERKLVDVDERTGRASDIIDELAAKEPILEEQSAAAQRYKAASSELASLEFKLICSEVTECSSRLSASEKELDLKVQARERAETDLSAMETEYETVRMKAADSAIGYDSAYMRSQAASKSAMKHELSIKDNEAELMRDRMSLERTSSDRDDTCKRLSSMRDSLKDLYSKKDSARERIDAKNAKIGSLSIKIGDVRNELQSIEKSMEKFKTDHFTLVSEVASIRTSLGSINERREASDARKARLGAMLAAKRQYITEACTDLEEEKSKLRKIVKEASETLGMIEAARKALGMFRAEEDSLTSSKDALSSELTKSRAVLAGLESLEQDYEGYSPAVKAVLGESKKGSLKGILCTVGEALNVPKGMETAIEAALGGQINDIICRTADDASKCVEYLKSNRAGRATFLPIDIIKSFKQGIDARLAGFDGFLGMASELVTFDKVFEPAVGYLLGATAVFKDLETAVKAQRMGIRVKSSTLDGETLTSGGAITGGARRSQQESVITRRNRISALKHETDRLFASLQEKNVEIDDLRKKAQVLIDELSTMEKSASETEARRKDIETAISRMESEVGSAHSQEILLNGELEDIESDELRWADDIAKLEKELIRAEQAAESHGDLSVSEKSQKGEKEAELASLMEGLTSHQIEKATYEAELKALDAEIAPMKASISRSEEELARLHQRIDELGSSIISLSSLIEDERRLCEGFQQEASLATKELEECRQRRGELESGLASLESDIKQKRRRLAQAQDAENRLSLESARFLGEFEALTARLKKEHGITFDDIPSEEGAAFDKEATSVRIEELKAAIESLGDVNLTAAEELDNLKSRLSFMRGQIEDLDKARASLAQVIKEAERTARKQFIEMFAQIRENFKELFAQLFEGGQADIVLVDEEEPLESGIEIICRPPGKKLSQLSLLSGGEKALAAIALIFSFLKSRPAPFCILDEIDAALDEANLQRFKELVSDYSKRSQMIIITHRRRTMESAGRVYGVTMEEQGVSKSVCVDTSQLTFQEGMV